MNYRLILRPEVEADLNAAAAWYEQRTDGLGQEFLRCARDTIDGLSDKPLIYQVRSRRKQIRWAYPRRFPYRIIFRVIHDTVIIYAFVYSARHDRQWKNRV